MFSRKKGQSTAEYAILLGLVIAVAAGVMQVALKGGVRQKHKQALNYLLDAGSDVADFNDVIDQDVSLYSQDFRKTTVASDDFVDETVLNKGGEEKKMQKQTSTTTSVNIETIDETGSE